jgi:hypothetical protein
LSACEPERTAVVRAAMGSGQVSFARALALTEATAHLDSFTAGVIASRVLRPVCGPDGRPLPGVAPLSQATFSARLRTQLVLVDGLVGHAERTYAEGLKGRRLSAQPHPDGTAMVFLSGDGARISAACGRVDRIARRLRKGGDGRTLAQLRADVATDLLLGGWVPGDPAFARLGRPPVARVNVVVSLATLLGVDAGVGQIPGWGALSAEQTRRVALQAGSIWTRVVSDPLTGRAIEASAGTYRVPAGMAQQVKTRDGTCRAPGCQIPAAGADLDHTIEWTAPSPDPTSHGQPATHVPAGPTTNDAAGSTSEGNLVALHRGHHNLKTSGFWDSEQLPDGTLSWTTATGRTVITYPFAYDDPDNLRIQTSTLEVHLGLRLAKVINPSISTPGHTNLLDEVDWAQILAPATPEPHHWPTRPAQQQPAEHATSDIDPPPPPF